MSLRIFHLVFISISTLFVLGFAVWLAGLAVSGGTGLLYLAAAGCVAAAAALVVYAVRFSRKTRNLVPGGSL